MVVAGAADGEADADAEADAEAEADAGAEADADGEALPLEEGVAEEGAAEELLSWAPGASSSRIFSATGREVTSPRLTVSRWGPGSAREQRRPQSLSLLHT